MLSPAGPTGLVFDTTQVCTLTLCSVRDPAAAVAEVRAPYYLSLTTYCCLRTAYYLLLAACCVLLAAWYSLLATCDSLLATH